MGCLMVAWEHQGSGKIALGQLASWQGHVLSLWGWRQQRTLSTTGLCFPMAAAALGPTREDLCVY